MWVRRAAIRSVPSYARVAPEVLERVEERLSGEDEESERSLEQAFSRFENTQPALSTRVANLLSATHGETALALGYFLTLSVWLAFDDAFASSLTEVSEQDLDATAQSVELDEELRKNSPDEAVDTDDVVAMEQPAIVTFIREHIDVALDGSEAEVEIDEIDEIYRLVLIEVLALSHAVRPPDRFPVSKVEWSA